MNNKWTKKEVQDAVKSSVSYAETLKKLGLQPRGSNYRTLKKYIGKFKINTSHYLGYAARKARPRPSKPGLPLINYLIINSTFDPKHLKTRLIRENLLPYRCAMCSIVDWNSEKLVLHLDHINGINNDHRLANLRLLCPNCHSQTKTYCGKNNKYPNSKTKHDNHCIDCNVSIVWKYGTRCRSCASSNASGSHPTKIKWPSTKKLISLVAKHGREEVGRQLGVSGLGVSGNAIKKRIQKHPND